MSEWNYAYCDTTLSVKTNTISDIPFSSEKPPITIKEGGIIKSTFNEEVQKLRSASTEGKNWVLGIEAREKERAKREKAEKKAKGKIDKKKLKRIKK